MTRTRTDKSTHTNKIVLLTSDQVVQKLGLKNRSGLHNACHRGHVPKGVRIPGVGVRWLETELDQWLAAQFEVGKR